MKQYPLKEIELARPELRSFIDELIAQNKKPGRCPKDKFKALQDKFLHFSTNSQAWRSEPMYPILSNFVYTFDNLLKRAEGLLFELLLKTGDALFEFKYKN